MKNHSTNIYSMLKQNVLTAFCILLMSCGEQEKNTAGNNENTDNPGSISYTSKDLHKLKWIEGKWKGLYKMKPFYEIYQFANDSTLEIISYDWNGNDSTNSSRSVLRWIDGAYYLGDQFNWKVTEITDSSITMMPNNKASNDILWKYNDSTSWYAILKSKKDTAEYHMQAYDPFKN
jgi:hypothetical protein